MILVDTSVWVQHLRKGDPALVDLLENDRVIVHPYVTGELACGNLRNRSEVLSLLQALPPSSVVRHDEILQFIESRTLMGTGAGLIDMHLLAATVLEPDAKLWTRDRRLHALAHELNVSYTPHP